MHASLQALFDEAKAPQHASKRDVHGILKSILSVGARVQHQMAVYRGLHLDAKLDEHDHALDPKQEHLQSTMAGAAAAAAAFIAAGEHLANLMTQLERQMEEGERDILAWETAQKAASANRRR